MPKIHEIVALINTSLKSDKFKSKRFQKGKFYAIAELMNDEQETKPCVVDNAGEAVYISIDDNYPFILYHRVISIVPNNNIDDEPNFGGGLRRTETANMLLVCYGDRTALQLNKEELIGGVSAAFPYEISKSNLSALNINKCEINLGTFNTDSKSVYDNEFNLKEYELKPQSIFFSLPYQIVTNYDVKCLTLCE